MEMDLISPNNLLAELGSRQKRLRNFVNGEWIEPRLYESLPNPVTGDHLLDFPATQVDELGPFLDGLRRFPKGLHNPKWNPERYLMLGKVCFNAAYLLKQPAVADYFARLIMTFMPKSYDQAMGEVTVSQQFLENFCGDRARYLARGIWTPGNRLGQHNLVLRYPYGPVALVEPFNFPAEIPWLNLLGALLMGNRPTIKVASTVSIVIEQFLVLLHYCGLPKQDVDLIHCRGEVMFELVRQGRDLIKLLQFTGSSEVAKKLRELVPIMKEDSGFDWLMLGPDFDPNDLLYRIMQIDKCAFGASGQKCSALSWLLAHANWPFDELMKGLAELAGKRNLADLTLGPIMTLTTTRLLDHITNVLKIPGSKLLFGGQQLEGHHIPNIYGTLQPTAIEVSLEAIMANEEAFRTATTEMFAPLMIVTRYSDSTLDQVLQAIGKLSHHLTAGIVSNDDDFVDLVLGATQVGTCYTGKRARTTGAEAWQPFRPGRDSEGGDIGDPEGIMDKWSWRRSITVDNSRIKPDEVIKQI